MEKEKGQVYVRSTFNTQSMLRFISLDIKVYRFYIKINLDCVDDPNGYDGVKCEKPNEQYCRYSNNHITLSADWLNKFRAACKKFCSQSVMAYCKMTVCEGCISI